MYVISYVHISCNKTSYLFAISLINLVKNKNSIIRFEFIRKFLRKIVRTDFFEITKNNEKFSKYKRKSYVFIEVKNKNKKNSPTIFKKLYDEFESIYICNFSILTVLITERCVIGKNIDRYQIA